MRCSPVDDGIAGARGTVLVSAPAGFTVAHGAQRYVVGRDGSATVQVTLHGALPSGVSSVAGSVRVLVDGEAEALPVPLVVSAG